MSTDRNTTIDQWARLAEVMPDEDDEDKQDPQEDDCGHLEEYKDGDACLRCQQESTQLYDGLLDATEGRSAGRTPRAGGDRR